MSTKKRLEKSKVPEPDSDEEDAPLTVVSNEPVPTPTPTPPPPIDAPVEVFKRRKYILSEEAKDARRMNLENARKVRAELAIIRANLKKEDFEAKRNNRQERLERIENERRLKMEQEIEEEVGRRVMRELSERPVQVRKSVGDTVYPQPMTISSQTRRHVQVVDSLGLGAEGFETLPKPIQQKPQFNVVFH